MLRFLSLLQMRCFSKSQAPNESACKMTNGGPPINDCSSSCISECQIMGTMDEVEAFISSARCKARCAHTNAPPIPGDCTCTNVCIVDMSEMYSIMRG